MKVVHFEIPVDDTKRAEDFYNEVFEWKINSIPDMGYTIVGTGPTNAEGMPQEPGFINGGMLKRQEPVKTPVITVEVEDIDAISPKIVEHGGQLLKEKVEVGDMGYSAYFKDTEGNILGLWQNKSH